MSHQNLGAFVLEKTNTFGDLPAFILKGADRSRKNLSFREFNSIVQKITIWFRHQHLQKGFKVGLLGENKVEWCALALATWNAGGVLVPISHIATDMEIQNICDAARLDVIFKSPTLDRLTPQRVKAIYSMDFSKKSKDGKEKSLGDILEDSCIKKNPNTFIQHRASDLAVLIFTSGTTGRPKGVMLTHNNIKSNVLDVISYLPGNGKDRLVSMLPLSHMFELTGGFLTCHMKGMCITYPDTLKPEDILTEMREHKATLLVAVPLFFEVLDRAINEKLDAMPGFAQFGIEVGKVLVSEFPSLGKIVFKKIHKILGGHMKYFVTGGAKISEDIIGRFTSYGIDMHQGYGLTETGPILTATSPKGNRIGSVGRILHSVKIRIDNPNENGEGEIVASGPNVFAGYFENPEATAEVLRDGWFYTGDVGKFDEAGFLFITGRKKDIIVTPNGKNIYPEEIESLLKDSPYFTEVAVLGLDSERGEAVHVAVVANSKVPGGSEETSFVWREIERLTERLADYKKPMGVTVFRTELPKTATRKVRKHILKELISSGRQNQDEAMGAEKTLLHETEEKEKWLANKIRQISKKDEIWYEANLRHDLGLDSLTFMELISNIESHWGTRISEEDFAKIEKVSDVIVRLGTSTPSKVSEGVSSRRGAIVADFDFRINNSWWMNSLRVLFHLVILRPFFKIYFRLKVVNSKVLEENENVVLTPNHSSHLDFPAVVASVPLRKINRFYAVAAADYFFNTPVKAFVVRLFFNCIPFDRKMRVEKGFKICENILEAGGSLLIFPEGTRSISGEMSNFKPGVGRLLASKKFKAVPIYIKGAYDAFPKGSHLPRPHVVEVRIGKPVFFTHASDSLPAYREVAAELEREVRQVAGKSYKLDDISL